MDVRVRAALELGYPPHRIALAMRRYNFRSAGALVDYLWNNLMEEEMELEMEVETSWRQTPSAPPPTFVKPSPMPPPPPQFDTSVVNVLCKSVSNLRLKAAADLNEEMLKETQMLYRLTHCLSCRLEKRNVLLFPCCHVSLCSSCALHLVKCPMKNCNESIEQTITVYLS